MAPSKVTDSYVLAIWKKLNKIIRRVRNIRAKFKVERKVRITKEKMKFTKGTEENFSRKYFELLRLLIEYPDQSMSWEIKTKHR
jgi:DNA-binding response OmpR family regulator